MKRDAFILIELLVIIAIIAILAAILFPVFAAAKQSTKASGCLSNMKQLALSAAMYLNDNDGALYHHDELSVLVVRKPLDNPPQ